MLEYSKFLNRVNGLYSSVQFHSSVRYTVVLNGIIARILQHEEGTDFLTKCN